MNRKPSIAIVVPGGLGTGKNDIGVPVLEAIVRLLAKDFSVTVFQLFKVNEGYTTDGFSIVSIHHSNPLVRLVKFMQAFRRYHKVHSFKVVHGFWALPCGLLAVLAGKVFKVKSVVSVLGGDAASLPEINYGRLTNAVSRRLTFLTLRQADARNALTQYLVENLKRAGLRDATFEVIPWGIDTSVFTAIQNQPSKIVSFLHVANLHPVKDQETLLRAFKIISSTIDAHLTIVGEGVNEGMVNSLTDELGLRSLVTFVKPVPYHELAAYYHEANVLLHTSLSEGQCEVVTEAMSCGLLVCGTKVGLMYDLPECCVTVNVRDYDGLARGVLQLLQDPERCKRMTENAWRWTKHHDIHWTVKRVKEQYQ